MSTSDCFFSNVRNLNYNVLNAGIYSLLFPCCWKVFSEISPFCILLRWLDELKSQLAEERDKVADLGEQLQKEKMHRERELNEAKEKYQFQISDLQDKVIKLVGISRRCFCSVTGFYKQYKDSLD